MLKLKYIRHPLRTLGVVQDIFSDHLSMKVLARRANAQFMGDARFSLQNVADGLVPRTDEGGDDEAVVPTKESDE